LIDDLESTSDELISISLPSWDQRS